MAKKSKDSVSVYLTRGINLVTALAVGFLGLRFVLRMFGANSSNGFVDWVYDTSGELIEPFRGIFGVARDGDFVIEFSTLFAILIYALLGMILVYAVNFFNTDAR